MTIRRPELQCVESQGLAVWTDLTAREHGVVIAFTERAGGASVPPYASLNLAGHVGDEPAAVDENRTRLLGCLGLSHLRDRLVTAEQVHGEHVALVGKAEAGHGASACGIPAVPASDALVTCEPDLPLMLCFADCVPLVLLAPGPGVAVVHAGWRGALAGLPGIAADRLAHATGCDARRIAAYIGPHIGACHYAVSEGILSQFVNTFGTVARAESGGLDLGSSVSMSLLSAGVDPCNIASLGTCTAETTDRFFSYRAEAGLTGRHGALACILSQSFF